jgi:hypothetical protein
MMNGTKGSLCQPEIQAPDNQLLTNKTIKAAIQAS